MSMTCFATLLDGTSREVEFANAGHTMPYLLRRSAAGYELGSLVSRGPALGSGDGVYQTQTRTLVPGDTFLWFTDGASETTSADGELFGERRLRRAFLETIGRPVAAARDHLLAALAAFQGEAPATDDRTIVVGRFE
jgi:sigma-B regulation protein RsbU (phosphoserine phosphatase)